MSTTTSPLPKKKKKENFAVVLEHCGSAPPSYTVCMSLFEYFDLLSRSVEAGDLVGLTAALDHVKVLEDWRICGTHTPITLAAMLGHAHVCELLLDSGANPDSFDRLGFSALMRAVTSGSVLSVCCLLRKGATIDKQSKCMYSTMLNAQTNHGVILIHAVEKSTALHIACKLQNMEIVKLLLFHGANIDLKDKVY
jgi:ankyrin repeat protein